MFLPDRYIKGECPVCHSPRTSTATTCEVCSKRLFAPTELINPYSTLTGASARASAELGALLLQAVRPAGACPFSKPGRRTASTCSPKMARKAKRMVQRAHQPRRQHERWPGRLGHQRARRPTSASRFRTSRASISMCGWMRRSAISRQPQEPASTRAASRSQHWRRRASRTSGMSFERIRGADPEVEQVHFIGKDIVYLPHPVLARDAEVQRAQDARPRSTCTAFITVNNWRKDEQEPRHRHRPAQIPVEPRHEPRVAALLHRRQAQCQGTKTSTSTAEDFRGAASTADLIGKYINIASRAAGFIAKRFGGQLGSGLGRRFGRAACTCCRPPRRRCQRAPTTRRDFGSNAARRS